MSFRLQRKAEQFLSPLEGVLQNCFETIAACRSPEQQNQFVFHIYGMEIAEIS